MTSQISPTTWRRSSAARPGPRPAGACRCDGDGLVVALAPGLRAVFDGSLVEGLPADLGASLAHLLTRLDAAPAAPPRDIPPRSARVP